MAVCDADGPAAGLRALMASVGGDAWNKLDAQTRAERVNALSSSAPFIGAHILGLTTLSVTEKDVTGFEPPALLLYGANSMWFESIIADQLRILRPDFRIVTIKNAAHNVHRDGANVVNAEVLAFLSKK
jgi:pimeloyl-ACP methyl ester carboxylesterase